MRLIWTALKQAGGDFWDEFLLLIIFNAIWLLVYLWLYVKQPRALPPIMSMEPI